MLEYQIEGECHNCGSTKLIADEKRAEIICSKCGNIVEERLKDKGPDWRDFGQKDRTSKRSGPPTDPLRYDKGLTTQIDKKLRDGKGRPLKPRQRKRAFNLRKTERRNKKMDARERSLSFAIVEIEKISSSLNLPKNVSDRAANLYRKAGEEGLIRGRSREGVATAAVYASCRILGTPRTMEEIASCSSVGRKEMRRSFLSLSRNLELDIPPKDPVNFINKFVTTLGLSNDIIIRSKDILSKAKEANLVTGRNPRGVIGAIIYLASKELGEKQTQKDIADEVDVTEVTLRNRFREFNEELDLDIL